MSNEEENNLPDNNRTSKEEEEGNNSSHEHTESFEENKPKVSKLSKFLTLILRHQPGTLNLDLDNDGWLSCTVDELVALLNEKEGFSDVTRDDIEEIVNNDPKGRYEIYEDLIRATYGHSAPGINPLEYPDDFEDLPEFLYYATNNFQLDTALRLGLIPREKRDRQFLHLSVEIKDAYTVAKHHSRNPKLVRIDVKRAHDNGVKFRKVAPFIVISDEIPSQFLEEIPLPEELQYLTHLNPERKYQKNRRRGYSKKRPYGSDKRSYRGGRRDSYSKSSRSNYDKRGSRKRFEKSRKEDKDFDFSDKDDDLDFDSPAEFGDIDDIKKKAQSKSTIHFETEKDEDVDFS